MTRALLPPDIGGTLGKSDNKWEDLHVDKINGANISDNGVSTTSAAGLMSAADKGKLDGVPTPTEGDAGKAVVVNDTEDGYELGDHLSGYEFETVSVTSTDDATSATAAPLKSAGGLAVAGNAWVGGEVRYGGRACFISMEPKVITGGSSVSSAALTTFNGNVNMLEVTATFRRGGTPNYQTGSCRRLIHVQGTTTGSVGILGTQESIGDASADLTIGWTNATRKLTISSVNTGICYVTVHICGDNVQNITWEV